MATSFNEARQCCAMEKKRLVEEIRKCDFCTTSYDEFHQCYRDASKESGERSRSCLVS